MAGSVRYGINWDAGAGCRGSLSAGWTTLSSGRRGVRIRLRTYDALASHAINGQITKAERILKRNLLL
jgi:hypothetical protein